MAFVNYNISLFNRQSLFFVTLCYDFSAFCAFFDSLDSRRKAGITLEGQLDISKITGSKKTFKNHLTNRQGHGILTEQKEEERTPFSPCRKSEHRFDTEIFPEKGAVLCGVFPHFFVSLNFLGVLCYKRKGAFYQ